ncbi:hypothetical protein DOTSEDRAFT_128422, partial [Dothistroma septosporum NZE10]
LCVELGLVRSSSLIVANNTVIQGAPPYRAYVRLSTRLRSAGEKGPIIPGGLNVRLTD